MNIIASFSIFSVHFVSFGALFAISKFVVQLSNGYAVVWIEIWKSWQSTNPNMSHLTRGAWIETHRQDRNSHCVDLRWGDDKNLIDFESNSQQIFEKEYTWCLRVVLSD